MSNFVLKRISKTMLKTKRALLILVGLFLCACGNNGSTDLASNDDVKQTAQQFREAKILRRGNGSDVESLDPQLARSESALNVVRDMYEGLVRQTQSGEIVPAVAREWVFNAGDQCFRFILRDDAKWSNGERVVADDFIRGWKYALDKKNASPYAELLKPLNNAEEILSGELKLNNLDVRASDDKTLFACLSHVTPDFLSRLALPVYFPRHKDTTSNAPISNGAYRLSERVPQSHITLSKENNYYASEQVYFDEVKFFTTEDSKSELKRYLAGELDITVTIPPNDVPRLLKSNAESVKIAPVLNTYFYGFNLKAEPFKDNLKLRRALSLVIDRDVLVNKIIGTGEQEAWTLVPPMIANYQRVDRPDGRLSQEERLDLAKRLYQEAGYSESNPVTFELRYNTSPLHKKIAVALATMWKEYLGAEVDLYNEEWKVFIQNRRAGKTQMFRSGWVADVNDASNYLELFTSTHPLNDYRFVNGEFDNLLKQASMQTELRPTLLAEAEQKLINEYAIIPLYYYVSKHLVHYDIQGWEDNVLDVHLSRDLSRKTPSEQ